MGFLSRALEFSGQEHRFAVYVPETARASLPIILYLHGLGRGGRDGERQTFGGLGDMIRESTDAFPFIVAFPQSPEDKEFVGPVAELCLVVLSQVQAEFGGDESRTYLVGGSMGGHGAYHMAVRHPRRFAGLVVTCSSPRLPAWRREELGIPIDDSGTSEFETVAKGVGSLPIWIFHGAVDETVPVEEARRTVSALRAHGNPVRYTEFPDAGHEGCSRAFREPGVWSWLGDQRLSA